MEKEQSFKINYKYITIVVLCIILLYYTQLYNYLLFHSIAEMFAVVIAYGIFIFSWNSQKFVKNYYFLFIGIAFLFIGSLDFIHLIAYKGIGVFIGVDANLATQLWILSRYIQGFSFVIALYFTKRDFNSKYIFSIFSAVVIFSLLTIFYFKIFPDCFIEGTGLTLFKIISEYVISLMMLWSVYLLNKNKEKFNYYVMKLIFLSAFITIASEMSFTLYQDVYGFSNFLGHVLKIASFYLIYLAVIQTGLKNPYDLLLRENKINEMHLERERDKAQKYFDIAGAMLIIINKNGNVELINKKGCEILRFRKEEIIGKNWFDNFIPERIRSKVKALSEKILHGGMYFENLVLIRNGEERLIAWHSTLLIDDKKNIIGYLNSGIDITEQKKAQKILQNDKDEIEKLIKKRTEELMKIHKDLADAKRLSGIGMLAASIAHELRNPLTVIMGAAYNIKKKNTDESIDAHIAKIEKKVIESDHIIDNLLGYASLKPPQFENVKLADILNDSINTTKQTLNNPKISINLNIEPIKDTLLWVDPLQIGEVFNNILINAGQAIKKESGKIEISGSLDIPGNEILLDFMDNGEGIIKENIDKIFNPFFTTKKRGTGLGLSISNEIINLHGGRIDIKSEKDIGTTFSIILPIAK